MHVAVREVKSSLSHVLSLAQAGEVIEVTSRGKPTFSPTRLRAPDGKPMGQMVLEDRG